jgi:hypothetical protein
VTGFFSGWYRTQPYPLLVVDQDGQRWLVIGWTGTDPRPGGPGRPEVGPWPVIVPMPSAGVDTMEPQVLPTADINGWELPAPTEAITVHAVGGQA